MLQSTGVDPYLTVRETVELYAGYYPKPRDVDEVIELVGLDEKRDTRVDKLSGGQQRRLDVAIGLAGDPELLFLDEPTTGFDPSARRHAWEMVKNLTELGKTVFLTTHFMDEAQYLADRVAVIARGEIVAEGPPATLGGRDTMRTVIRFRLPSGTEGTPPLGQVATADGTFEVHVDDPTKALHELTGWALEREAHFERLEVTQPTLEDVYLAADRWRGGGRMSAVGLTLRQVRYTNKAFWRNPASAFFTFAFPLMFLVIFTALLGGGDDPHQGHELEADHVLRGGDGDVRRDHRLLHEHRDQRLFQPRRGDPQADPRDAAPRVVIPERARGPRDDRGRDPRRDHAVVRQGVLRRHVPDGDGAPGVHDHVPGRGAAFAALALALTGGDPQRGRGAAHRQRRDPAVAVPLGHLHPAR